MSRWLPFVVWLAVVAGTVFSADTGRLRSLINSVNRLPLGDKAGHFFLIGGLALCLNFALKWRTSGRRRFQLGGLIILVLITLEEISQLWIARRHFDLVDLSFNYLGILCAEVISRLPARRARTTSSAQPERPDPQIEGIQ